MSSLYTRGIALFTIALALSGNAAADNRNLMKLEFGNPIRATALVTSNSPNYLIQDGATATKRTMDVYLMNIKLDEKQKESMLAFQQAGLPLGTHSTGAALPASVQLGMNKVPVLNQGRHGSCATFANTAAIDALLNKGDYVSQLSLLELGSYLDNVGYLPDGWNGSLGPYVLGRMREFGIVKKTNPNEYPLDANNTGTPLSLENYHKLSEDINSSISWYSVLAIEERLAWTKATIGPESERILNSVKNVLATKPSAFWGTDVRVTFGALLPVNHCVVGACAKFHAKNDTWALADEIVNDRNPDFGGHEMVITGYDDNAVAVDEKGKTHTGLLTLRNSWSDKAGDKGDFYMSYDYFRAFVLEAQIVTKE